MMQAPDGLLLTTAQIAATLMGLLIVGAFFYLETGFVRLRGWGPGAGAFFRAAAKLIFLLYTVVLALSLGLVVTGGVAVSILFGALSLAVLGGLLDVTRRARRLPAAVRKSHAQHWALWPPVLFSLVYPWAASGLSPDRGAFVVTILVAGVLAFYLTISLLLFAFDLSLSEEEVRSPGRPVRSGSR